MRFFLTDSSKNKSLLKLTVVGVSMLLLAATIAVVNPVKKIVDSQLTLRPGSMFYNLWLKPPLEVFITVYMFNVTNAEAFRTGVDSKLKLEEVGPYVYQEVLENLNVSFHENSTVTYYPKRTMKFVRERSIGDPKVDRIVAPNIAYMGVSSAATEMTIFASLAVRAITKKLDSKAMLEIPVHDYLWGHDDRIVQLASSIMPSIIPFQRFGLLERIFDEGRNLVTMKLPEKQTQKQKQKTKEEPKQHARDFSIDNWNGRKDIKFWNKKSNENTTCNSVSGAYDVTLFPRDIQQGESFRIYRKAFCRTLPITFSNQDTFDGIEGYKYTLPLNVFDSDVNDPNTSCFCKGNKCLKRGLGNVTPCYYNIPLAMSFPHFMGGDPSLHDKIEGLKADESKHGTEIVLQPQLGIPMRIHSRFQINLLVGNIKFNADIERFRDTALPIFWLEMSVNELSPGLILLMKMLFTICPYTQVALIVVLIIAGISLVGMALVIFFWKPMTCTSITTAMDHKRNLEPTKLPHVCRAPLLMQQPKRRNLFKLRLNGPKSKNRSEDILLRLQGDS